MPAARFFSRWVGAAPDLRSTVPESTSSYFRPISKRVGSWASPGRSCIMMLYCAETHCSPGLRGSAAPNPMSSPAAERSSSLRSLEKTPLKPSAGGAYPCTVIISNVFPHASLLKAAAIRTSATSCMFARPTATSPCERRGRPGAQSLEDFRPTGRTTAYGTPLPRSRCSCSRCLSRVPKGFNLTMGMSTTNPSRCFFSFDQAVRVTAAEDSRARQVPWLSCWSCLAIISTGPMLLADFPKGSRPFNSSIGEGELSSREAHQMAASAPSSTVPMADAFVKSHTQTSSCSLSVGRTSAAFSALRTTPLTVAPLWSSLSTAARPTLPVAPKTVTMEPLTASACSEALAETLSLKSELLESLDRGFRPDVAAGTGLLIVAEA
mmetsp:Transcript_16990/g.47445  ORF Transcript_16990/g.47445 Transcript_16990/m.47445 type:complete len:379 (-) Transcript_16990:330-1466(-)